MIKKQLILTGFHRSGTSMVAQEIHNAGLFLGYNLLGAHISNQDGHFEDRDFYTLHDDILQYNQENWQFHNDNKVLGIPSYCKNQMRILCQQRNERETQWGFKDPRTSLFLKQWHDILDNPFVVVIYRHFDACVNSLLTRSSRNIAYNKSSDISFWKEPALAYKMWLAYNKKIIEYIKYSPDNCILVSHQSIVDGLNIVELINEKFHFDLSTRKKKKISKSLISSSFNRAFTLPIDLENELQSVWLELEQLSIVSSQYRVEDFKKDTRKSSKRVWFRETCKALHIPTKIDNKLYMVLMQLVSNTIPISEKIKLIRTHLAFIRNAYATQELIKIIHNLISESPEIIDLYQILSNLYLEQKDYQQAEYIFLQAFTRTDGNIAPYIYDHLGMIYLQSFKFEAALYFIDKAIEKNSRNHLFYFHKAKFFQKQYKYTEALKYIEIALELHPNHLPYYFFTLDIYYILNDTAMVTKILNIIEEKFPDNTAVQNKRANIFHIKKFTDSKIEEMKKDVLCALQENIHFYSHILLLCDLIQNNEAQEHFMTAIASHLKKLEEKKI